MALQYLEDPRVDTISMHHIDGDGVTPTDRLRVGMVLGSELSLKFFGSEKLFVIFL